MYLPHAKMFSLTVREQILVASILLAVISGNIIHHLRTRSAADGLVSGGKLERTTAPADETFAP